MTLADNVEIVVEDGAQLAVVSIDDWADDAVHVGHRHSPRWAATRKFKHVDITFGGDVVRHDTTADYAGPGGAVEMLGLYFADAGQHIEHRLFVDHTAPEDCKSHVVYKGALQGEKAHTVWIGNVLIRKVAEGIETYEENRNLRPHRRLPGRLRPQPRDRDRRDRGCGPRVRATGALRRRAALLPDARAASPRRRRSRLVVHGFFNDLIQPDQASRSSRRASTATVEARARQERRTARCTAVTSLRTSRLAERGPRRRRRSRVTDRPATTSRSPSDGDERDLRPAGHCAPTPPSR